MITVLALVPFTITPHLMPNVNSVVPDRIVRYYAPNEKLTYKIDLDMPAQKEHISGTIHWFVTKNTQAGATVSLKLSDAAGVDKDGKATPMPIPDAEWIFTGNGMSDKANISGNSAPFALLCYVSYLPGDLSSSKQFSIDWSTADKGTTLKGSGSYEGLQSIDGKNAATIKTDMTIRPSVDPSVAQLHNTSYFDPATGILIRAIGVLTVSGVTANLTLKQE